MPIFKAGPSLVYYAHVPKCGGYAVSWYLRSRFGSVAFVDSRHTGHEPATRWSRTSPQHIDCTSLARLFPEDFFDATFTIVRHPVGRIVSAYHFQRDVEQLIPAQTGFSDWLADVEERLHADPFLFDNHVRPMSDLVPKNAKVFHFEHGLDALVPWLDALTGCRAGPRAIPRMNEQGAYAARVGAKAAPSSSDLERIARLYARDFDRFGYRIDATPPAAAAPILSAAQLAERDAALKAMKAPIARLKRQVGKLLS